MHLVSNGKMDAWEFGDVALGIDRYVDYFHIREKHLSARDLYKYIQVLLEGRLQPSKIIVHDRVDVAQALGIKGVQLTTHSLPVTIVRQQHPGLLIGCSTHSVDEVKVAEEARADFAFYGHVYESTSKLKVEPRGITRLKEIVENSKIPIIAIGGITPDNTKSVLENGASGIAVMSGILNANDPVKSAEHYWKESKEWKEAQYEQSI